MADLDIPTNQNSTAAVTLPSPPISARDPAEIILRIILLTVPIRQGQNIDIDAAGAAPLLERAGFVQPANQNFGSVILQKGNSHAHTTQGRLFRFYPPPI